MAELDRQKIERNATTIDESADNGILILAVSLKKNINITHDNNKLLAPKQNTKCKQQVEILRTKTTRRQARPHDIQARHPRSKQRSIERGI